MEKNGWQNILNIIAKRVINGAFFAIPASVCCLYIWILGYNLPQLIIGLVVIMCVFFSFGMLKPLGSMEEISSVESLRERLIDESKADDKAKDILELILSNMGEIREYYSLSKKQARLSFFLSILFCLVGVVIFIISIFTLDSSDIELTRISVIGGAVSELFATTALVIHKSALKQLNTYYSSLHENERFLSIVNLANQLPSEKRFNNIENIINTLLLEIASTNKTVKCSNSAQKEECF
ncbi:MAG: hypothetical protein HDR20_07325 [Lachnospiraceae bacterium]|nr:hypothetical protein [Lachnospiraceae bacterium]